MGKGDKKSKKGKIFKGSHAKSRPNTKRLIKLKQQKTQSESTAKE
jgi:ribosomal small subunit protein bTHX